MRWTSLSEWAGAGDLPFSAEIQASVLHRRSSHLQPCQPHVTCYTALHRVQSVWFSGLLHQLFAADFFPSGKVVWLHHCQSVWLGDGLPKHVLQPRSPSPFATHRRPPPSSLSHFFTLLILITVLGFLPGSFWKCDGCAGGPNETLYSKERLRHSEGASALALIGWSGSLKCWVIFSKDVFCSFSGEVARIDIGVTRIRWRGWTIVAFGKVVQHQNRWASFQAWNGNCWLWNLGQYGTEAIFWHWRLYQVYCRWL